MINLLAPIDKEALKKEYLRHKLVVAGVLWCVAALAAVVIFASLYVVIYLDRVEVEKNLARAKAEYETASAGISDRFVSTTNQQTKLVLTPQVVTPTVVHGKFVALRPKGVTINRIGYQPTEKEVVVSLGGLAVTRQDFLRFLENLKKEPSFVAVDSPVDNLIKERNVRFQLTVHVKI